MIPQFDDDQQIIDPQNRRIVYSYSNILDIALDHKFSDEVPPHFNAIFTKPDLIYMDNRNNVYCYQKAIRNRSYSVSVIETMYKGRKCFRLNSWFAEVDENLEAIQLYGKAHTDPALNEQMQKKIDETRKWMKILYSDTTRYKAEKYKKAGITVNAPKEPN